jgi:gamma-tubulin complex component 2
LHIHSVTHDKTAHHTDLASKTSISGLESFTLDYTVKWPLSLIISKKALTQYQILFRHLFYAKHVERQLCNLWMNNKESKRTPLHNRSWYSTAFTLRTRMIHFVQNFEYYMMFEVIEPYWHALEENLRSVRNIDGVLNYHNDFLAQCLKDCMLSNPELLKIVSKLMSVCVLFGNCFQRYNKSASLQGKGTSAINSNAESLSQSQLLATEHFDEMMGGESIETTIKHFDTKFTEQLMELLDKLTDEEQQMMSLVSRIDHNNYYSETQRNKLQVVTE